MIHETFVQINTRLIDLFILEMFYLFFNSERCSLIGQVLNLLSRNYQFKYNKSQNH